MAITDAFVNTCGGVRESVWVVIDDVPKENWGFGGRLGSDPKPGA
jgi:4-oxalocrotonate tautomerase